MQQRCPLYLKILLWFFLNLALLPKCELKLRPPGIRGLVEQAIQREAKNDSQINHRHPVDLEVVGEPELLKRAMANLIRNAIRYAGHCDPITVSARREGHRVQVTMADNGPGVSEQLLQRLFDLFFRVDDACTREGGNVGLGLTIVKTCV